MESRAERRAPSHSPWETPGEARRFPHLPQPPLATEKRSKDPSKMPPPDTPPLRSSTHLPTGSFILPKASSMSPVNVLDVSGSFRVRGGSRDTPLRESASLPF